MSGGSGWPGVILVSFSCVWWLRLGSILVSFRYHCGGFGGSGWLGIILVSFRCHSAIFLVGLVAPAGLVSFTTNSASGKVVVVVVVVVGGRW